MSVAKVTLNGDTTLMDTTGVTVNEENLMSGFTALDNTGTLIEGEATGGAVSVSAKDVNFIDYDGTVIYSYTVAEFTNLTSLPANPSHDGLIAQGWNWTLADAKSYVATCKRLDIGQMYTTSDGKTRIYVHIDDASTVFPMYVRFTSSIANNVTLNWGDGYTETLGSTTATNYSHYYVSGGNYIITLQVNNGTIRFEGSTGLAQNGDSIFGPRAYTNACGRSRIKKVEIGDNVSIEGYTFTYCSSLETITLPITITSFSTYSFSTCSTLKAITIPSGTTSIESNAFSSCYHIKHILLPKGVSSIGSSAFMSAYDCRSIVLTSNSSIETSTFNGWYGLSYLCIPASVTSIAGSSFSNAPIGEIHLFSETPPTLANVSAFSGASNGTVFYVPYSADHSILNAYKTATNWSTFASQMQEEPQ